MTLVNPDLPLYAPEGQLTCALLDDPTVYDTVRWLDVDLFRWAVTRQVYVAIQWVLAHHPRIGSDELVGRVRDLLIEFKRPEALALLVRSVGQHTGLPVNAHLYATQIYEARQREDLRSMVMGLAQVVNSDVPIDLLRTRVADACDTLKTAAETEAGWRPIDGLTTVGEFMRGGDGKHEWVIPGMLERQERLMVIAPEKAGKSVLTRQVALMLASGRHPFRQRTAVPPMTTLLVDLENPAPVARRDFRRQVGQLADCWSDDNGRAHILHRPAGIHLGDASDRMMLHRAMDHINPDLICVSPIYKAYDGLQQSWEEQAFGVQKPLDRLRQEFDCAIWLEHHPPGRESGRAHREIRPFGSTRWGRWLDYQVALNPDGDARPPYRELWWNSVQRDQRKMAPMKVRRGLGSEPSWVPVWEDEQYGFDMAMTESEA